jgi:hypothetical protein
MSAHEQTLLVHAVFLGVAEKPRGRAQHLAHDLFDGDRRAQVVVDQHQRDAGVDPRRREEREIAFVERSPVSAVDEHEHRAVALARREDIELLSGRRPVLAVQVAGHGRASARR